MQGFIKLSDLPALERAYKKALALGKDSFKFKDMEFVTAYAGYLIEYAERRVACKG